MIEWVLKKIIGTKNDRELKRALPKVARINELETKMRASPPPGKGTWQRTFSTALRCER